MLRHKTVGSSAGCHLRLSKARLLQRFLKRRCKCYSFRMIRAGIEKAIREALLPPGYEGQMNFVVERPSSFEHGDYATNVALAAAKMLKKNPKEVADALV